MSKRVVIQIHDVKQGDVGPGWTALADARTIDGKCVLDVQHHSDGAVDRRVWTKPEYRVACDVTEARFADIRKSAGRALPGATASIEEIVARAVTAALAAERGARAAAVALEAPESAPPSVDLVKT